MSRWFVCETELDPRDPTLLKLRMDGDQMAWSSIPKPSRPIPAGILVAVEVDSDDYPMTVWRSGRKVWP